MARSPPPLHPRKMAAVAVWGTLTLAGCAACIAGALNAFASIGTSPTTFIQVGVATQPNLQVYAAACCVSHTVTRREMATAWFTNVAWCRPSRMCPSCFHPSSRSRRKSFLGARDRPDAGTSSCSAGMTRWRVAVVPCTCTGGRRTRKEPLDSVCRYRGHPYPQLSPHSYWCCSAGGVW
jgi:hypothetical protein